MQRSGQAAELLQALGVPAKQDHPAQPGRQEWAEVLGRRGPVKADTE
jgi:hypothetical protein